MLKDPRTQLVRSGQAPKIAAADVRRIGRSRCVVAWMTLSQGDRTSLDLDLDLINENNRIPGDHSNQRNNSKNGNEPQRLVVISSADTTPISPKGATLSTKKSN